VPKKHYISYSKYWKVRKSNKFGAFFRSEGEPRIKKYNVDPSKQYENKFLIHFVRARKFWELSEVQHQNLGWVSRPCAWLNLLESHKNKESRHIETEKEGAMERISTPKHTQTLAFFSWLVSRLRGLLGTRRGRQYLRLEHSEGLGDNLVDCSRLN
jgi:hypothetical protein